MADAISIQELIDARTDAKTLEQAVNGDAVTTVLSRLGETYPTLSNALNQIDSKLDSADAQIKQGITNLFENGGLPATPFNTKALMTASALVDGQYAMVTDDTVNNGLYVKTAGAWVKSAYDPLTQAKTYTDTAKTSAISTAATDATIKADNAKNQANTYTDTVREAINDTLKTAGEVDLSIATNTLFASSSQGRWVSLTGYSGKLLPVVGGRPYTITGNANGKTKVMFILEGAVITANSAVTNVSPTNGAGILLAANEVLKIDAPTNATHLWMSNLNSETTNNLVTLPSSVVQGIDNLVYKTDIVQDANTGGANSVLSGEVGVNLQNSINAVKRHITPFVPISTDIGITLKAAYAWSALQPVANTTVKSVEIVLQKGDVLTFDYTPLDGVILWDWRTTESTGKAFALLAHNAASNQSRSHTQVAYANMTVRLSNANASTIKVNNVTLTSENYTDIGSWFATQKPIYNTTFFTQAKTTDLIQLYKGDEVVVTQILEGAMVIVRQDGVDYRPIYGAASGHPEFQKVSWVADADVKVRLTGTKNSEFLIRRITTDLRTVTSAASTASVDYSVPSVLQLGEVTSVFATSMNYILDTKMIDGVDHIRISTNLGKTYTTMPNILGDIVHYHFFSDGTIMLCSPTKVYWTDDYLTLNEAVIYDHDGTVFVPTHRHFFAMQNSDKTMHIDGKEIFVWGDYMITGTPRIWYSTDRGRTIKCAAKFGTTVMDGKTRKVRHVHRVSYREKDSSFYITTGDHGFEGAENMVLRANYDFDTDVWTWKFYNSGWNYKFGAIFFDDVYAYLLTDYTNPDQQDIQGFYRVLPEHLGDFSKYRAIYKPDLATLGETAFSRFFMDKMGNKVILPDWKGFGVIWVAREGMAFERVQLSKNIWLAYMIGANYNGDIYSVEFDNFAAVTANGGANIKLNRGTYNLTKALRNSGVNDFMRGHTLINDMGSISEQP